MPLLPLPSTSPCTPFLTMTLSLWGTPWPTEDRSMFHSWQVKPSRKCVLILHFWEQTFAAEEGWWLKKGQLNWTSEMLQRCSLCLLPSQMPQATPRRNFRDTIGPGLPRSHELHRCEPLAVGWTWGNEVSRYLLRITDHKSWCLLPLLVGTRGNYLRNMREHWTMPSFIIRDLASKGSVLGCYATCYYAFLSFFGEASWPVLARFHDCCSREECHCQCICFNFRIHACCSKEAALWGDKFLHHDQCDRGTNFAHFCSLSGLILHFKAEGDFDKDASSGLFDSVPPGTRNFSALCDSILHFSKVL